MIGSLDYINTPGNGLCFCVQSCQMREFSKAKKKLFKAEVVTSIVQR